jgi:hypothetical protein
MKPLYDMYHEQALKRLEREKKVIQNGKASA